MASTLESAQYEDFHLQSDHLCGILTISVTLLPLRYLEVSCPAMPY